ncbi:MAG: endonuclease MutS2 [Thermodesulfobacteriota bacterium]
MDETTLKALEFPAVVAELASLASTPVGAEALLATRPLGGLPAVERAFAEYAEIEGRYARAGRLPMAGVPDIRPLLKKAAPDGACLRAEEFLAVGSLVEAAAALRALLTPEFRKDFPLLASTIESISDQRLLASEITHALDDKGRVRDDASGELRRIRGEMRSARARAKSVLDAMVEDPSTAELLQEEIITIREDRYVLCVKAGKHTGVRGVVHGRSGSGLSFFIEPFAIVELNNALALLGREERAEEVRILTELTGLVLSLAGELRGDLDVMARLDALEARALFAGKVDARVPEIEASGGVRLAGARHPLLVLQERAGGGGAVPVDITIEPGRRVLVISGANTGGKTVALKTLGLLTLMVLSGIPVPVEAGSTAVAFDAVFADIGDSQDIEASLSTFSAHVARMRGFLTDAGPGSLVLIDEIGAGTNPAEGGALALASIEALRSGGAVVAVTTHLGLIKAHAHRDPGYTNASVEFDEKTLRPLYRLRYGMPGPSLGLSIARGLGLPDRIVESAGAYLDESESAFMESVERLDKTRGELEAVKTKLAELESKRDEAVARLREERERILARARKRVEGIVEKAAGEVREAAKKAREAAKEAGRAGGRSALPSLRGASSALDRAAAAARKDLGGKRPRPYAPRPGERVRITGSTTQGVVEVVDGPSKRAELLVGAKKVWVPWEKLTGQGQKEGAKGVGNGLPKGRQRGRGPSRRPPGGGERPPQDFGVNADMMEVAATINIIGRRVEEAMPLVTRFLDTAHAAGLERVEIIHGVGTGALRAAVREHTGALPYVRGLSAGDPDHGGAGVTVVELA